MQKRGELDVELLKSAGSCLAGRRHVGRLVGSGHRIRLLTAHAGSDWQGCPGTRKRMSCWTARAFGLVWPRRARRGIVRSGLIAEEG